tara:strand:- start:644 stop:772 length:129 start_codon:yes stop_codon:yes gene_type:complete
MAIAVIAQSSETFVFHQNIHPFHENTKSFHSCNDLFAMFQNW